MLGYEAFWEQLQHAYPISHGTIRLPIACEFLQLDGKRISQLKQELIDFTELLLQQFSSAQVHELVHRYEPAITPLLEQGYTGVLRYDMLLDVE